MMVLRVPSRKVFIRTVPHRLLKMLPFVSQITVRVLAFLTNASSHLVVPTLAAL